MIHDPQKKTLNSNSNSNCRLSNSNLATIMQGRQWSPEGLSLDPLPQGIRGVHADRIEFSRGHGATSRDQALQYQQRLILYESGSTPQSAEQH